jgi:3-hydroxyisobutyrate dehydrogenase-like beta-hydroxyacid dehydrogenase
VSQNCPLTWRVTHGYSRRTRFLLAGLTNDAVVGARNRLTIALGGDVSIGVRGPWDTRGVATGFLHPGERGASIAALCDGETVWCSAGRSPATRRRAAAAGMTEVGSLAEMAERVDLIVAICPPATAEAIADAVAIEQFGGIYADLNAIAPATARRLGERFEHFVDGGIIGPPATTPGTTRLYLSGTDAAVVASRWRTPQLDVRIVDGGVGAASAVKTCFAAWTKGSAALLLTVRALARAEDVEGALLAEWATSIPGLVERSERAARDNGPKAWRFVGEMHEIGASLADAGLPAGFAIAAAEVYQRLADTIDA